MGKITKIEQQKKNKENVNIYIDDKFCTGAKKEMIHNLNLKVDDQIDCEELKAKINLFWKEKYKEKWEEEKTRIIAVIEKLKRYFSDPKLKFEIFGFGTNTNQIIKNHPVEKGIPDIIIIYEKNGFNYGIVLLEITGTQRMEKTDDIWIRPDKFEFAKNHPNLDIFIAHYINDKDLLRFIDTKKLSELPKPEQQVINNTIESYIKLPYNHECIKSLDDFIEYLKEKLKIFNS